MLPSNKTNPAIRKSFIARLLEVSKRLLAHAARSTVLRAMLTVLAIPAGMAWVSARAGR